MFMGQNVFKLHVLWFTGKCEAHIVAMARSLTQEAEGKTRKFLLEGGEMPKLLFLTPFLAETLK